MEELRHDEATTIEICAGIVVKRIRNFASRPAVPHTTLAMIQSAYAASAASPGNFLVGAKSAPKLSDHGTYAVKTYPVGYTYIPTQEKVGLRCDNFKLLTHKVCL